MARTDPAVRRAAEQLSRPGPYAVANGDLAAAGLPGVVFTPRSGRGLAAIAFGHGWLQPTSRYDELMRHLASWGVVVAAPATQRNALASHSQFAADLRTALDLCTSARLGDGEISVDPRRLGLAGHGMGGGCAVLAAAADNRCRAVVTLALAETLPSAVTAAHGCTMPGLHVVGGKGPHGAGGGACRAGGQGVGGSGAGAGGVQSEPSRLHRRTPLDRLAHGQQP